MLFLRCLIYCEIFNIIHFVHKYIKILEIFIFQNFPKFAGPKQVVYVIRNERTLIQLHKQRVGWASLHNLFIQIVHVHTSLISEYKVFWGGIIHESRNIHVFYEIKNTRVSPPKKNVRYKQNSSV